ncbi:MAG: hypothetical protein ISP43_05435 [Candidatus Puniceispirillum sp.]|nr:hypothetical protein [Candidatus Puniceispirillum sp.]
MSMFNRILLVSSIIITLISHTASAQTVFYCSMTEFVAIEKHKFKAYNKEAFQMIKSDTISFRGGYLNGITMQPFDVISDNHFSGVHIRFSHMSYSNGDFSWAMTGASGSGTLVSAKCSK